MKIKNKILHFGLIGVDLGIDSMFEAMADMPEELCTRISHSELEKVARTTLSFQPLENIFNLVGITVLEINNFSAVERRVSLDPNKTGYYSKLPQWVYKKVKQVAEEMKVDIIAIISNDLEHKCSNSRNKFIYSPLNSIGLAHQLGHILGLKHPSPNCGRLEECGEEDYKINCQYSKSIMGCGYSKPEEPCGFSPEDIEKLKRRYPK